MKHAFLFLASWVCFFATAQNRYNVDSLNRVLRTTPNDTVKITTLQWIFDNYMYTKPDSAKWAYQKMFSISEKTNFDHGYYEAYLYKAVYYWTSSKFDSVIASMNGALKHALLLEDDGKISNCYVRLAMAQSSLGNQVASRDLTFKALEIAEKNNDWEGLYFCYHRLGNLYQLESNFDQALIYHLKVDSIFQNRARKEPALAGSLHEIGSIFMEFKDYEKAEQYYMKSKEVYREMSRKEGEVLIDVKMAGLKISQEEYEQATEILVPAFDYYEAVGNKMEMSTLAGMLAEAQLKLNDLDRAEGYYSQGAALALEAANKFLEAQSYMGLAEVAKGRKNFRSTIDYLSRALVLYEEMGVSYNKAPILESLAEAHSGLNNDREALRFFRQYQGLTDSLREVENVRNVQEIETKYQTEKKQQEIELLTAQNELAEQEKSNQRNLFFAGGSVLTLSLIGLFFLYRNKQRTNTKLRELDEMKSSFFANISHEFRTPLTLISSPIQEKLENEKLTVEDRETFGMIQRNNDRLLNLVDQLLDLSKIDTGNMRLKVQKGDLFNLLGALSESFQYIGKQKNITYSIQLQKGGISSWYDRDMMEKIVLNLLSNAFKHTGEGGSVVFEGKHKEGENLVLTVRNSAPSLSQEELINVFDRFYQASPQSEGSGIGLALVKELVSLHKGHIRAWKEAEEVTFEVSLPVDEGRFSKEERLMDPITGQTKRQIPIADSPVHNEDPVPQEDHPILLVVEDHAEVRELLRKTFTKDYNVITASQGEEGLEKALEYIPDLIISDIMMPVKDGIALSKELKSDERTSHIPVILLTAKAGEENELKGIETGADDYMVKPFKRNLLRSKVEKLIALRKQLQNRYSQEVVLKPKDIAITSIDERFLERVQQVLDQNLVESAFTVEEFSRAVGMSRMQLHRKLKALTGLSATEFIRSQRLKLAAQLLQQSDSNVSQVGYAVGFNDHSYFTKCFRELYHMTPSEYAKKDS